MAVDEADVRLVFGVAGGSDPEGDSGRLIKKELTALMNEMNKTPFEVNVAVTFGKENESSWGGKLQEQLNEVSKNSNLSIEIQDIKLGSSAVENLKVELNNAIKEFEASEISLKATIQGGQVTTNTNVNASEVGRTTEELQKAQEAATQLKQKIADINTELKTLAQVNKSVDSAMTSLANASQTDGERQKVDELKQKYSEWQAKIDAVKVDKQNASIQAVLDLEKEGKELERIALETKNSFSPSTITPQTRAIEDNIRVLQQAEQITKTISSAQTNLQGWSASKNGTSSEDYAKIQDAITGLKDLKTEVENNAISYDEAKLKYEQFVAQINASSANISLAGENTLSTEDLDRVNTKAAELKIGFDNLKASVSSVGKEITALDQASETPEEKQAVEDLRASYNDWCVEVQKLRDDKANASVEAMRNLEDEGNEYQKIASIIKDTFNSTERERNIQQIKEETQQLKQEEEITKAIASAQKNLRDWTAAENGTSSGSYKEIQNAVKGLQDLKTEVNNNTISYEEAKAQYEQYIATIKASSAEIAGSGENTKTAEELEAIRNNAAAVKVEFETLTAVSKTVKATMDSLWKASESEEEKQAVEGIEAAYDEWRAKVQALKDDKANASVEAIKNLEEEGEELRNIALTTKDTFDSAERERNIQQIREETQQLKQEEEIIKAIASAQKNLSNWGASERGTSSGAYSDIKDAITGLEQLEAKVKSGGISSQEARALYQKYMATISSSEATIRAAGEDHKTFAQSIADIGTKLTSYFSLMRVMTQVIQTIKKMISAVEDIDSAMAQLQIVTGATDTEMTKFLTEATELAKELGQSITDILGSIETFSRLGYNLEDASSLAEYAAILSNVASTTTEEATTGLTAIIKGYNMDVSDAEHVADVLVEVGQKYAISASELMEAFEKSGAALNASNTGFEESAALYAAANASVQNASTIGTALKTVSARIRGSTTELSELGEETEELANGFSKYAKELKALTGVDILEEGTTDTYKNIYQIFSELAEVWDELSDTQQSRASEILGGTRQLQVISSILSNWDDAAGAYADAMDSAGVATEANAIYMDTINAHIEQFRVEFQALSYDLIDSGLVKGIVDIGAGVLSMLDSVAKLISKIGGLKTILIAVGGAILAMKIGDILNWCKELPKHLSSISGGLSKITSSKYIQGFKAMGAGIKGMATGSDEAKASFQALGGATSVATAGITTATLAITAAIAIFSAYKQAVEKARQATIDIGESAKESAQELSDLTSNYLSLATQVDKTADEQEEFLNLQNEIIEKLGLEQYQIDDLESEYNDLTNAILAAEAAQLYNNARDIAAEADVYAEQAVSNTKGTGTGRKRSGLITYDESDIADSRALAVLQQAGYVLEASGDTIALATTGYDTSSIEGLIAEYNDLNDMMTLVSSTVGRNNSVYEQLSDRYKYIKEDVENYTDSVIAANEALIQSFELSTMANGYEVNGELVTGVPETAEEFEAYREAVLGAVEADQNYIETSVDLADTVDSVLSKESSFSNFYVTEAENILGMSKVYAEQYDDLAELLSSLQSAYSLLETAETEMEENGGLSADTISSLASATSNYLDYLYEENGVIKLNTEAWREAANVSMTGTINSIQSEIDALEEANEKIQQGIGYYETYIMELENGAFDESAGDVEEFKQYIEDLSNELEENSKRISENQDLLAKYSAAYADIAGDLTAYEEALEGFTKVDNIIKNVADTLTTIADLQEAVADSFTMSIDKALEFAEVYPEILNNATVAADGQIALDENVVNAFIEGKQAEQTAAIDEQIAELEADKEVLEAKLAYAEAELDLAEQVALGESEEEKALAEYRIQTGNAITEAMIDCGIDEATAFALAAAAMADDWDEYNRIATQVCTDMDGNFDTAAYDMALALYNNCKDGSISLSDLAKQAHQTAEAIAGVGSGEVKGSEALVTVGGGGTSGNGGTITITEGTFNGSDYTYTANTLDLDDFISDLEVDIETYRNAISQIDGQIAALEALKSKPLETFSSSYGTSTGSSSSSSSSSNNEDELDEVEEYLADIDEYYKALKRLEAIEIRLSDLSANLEYVDTDQERIILTSQLINLYEDEADALEDLDNLRKNTIRNGVAELESYGFVVSYNDQTNEFVIENMEHLNELEADTQEETNEFRQTVEELIDTLDDLNASNQDDADSLRSLRSEIKSAKQDVIDYLNDIVTAASDVVDMYQNVYDVLHQAADEFAASGFITIDTLQSIIELGPQYMQYLMDENGLLVINEENINKVIAAKTEQMALDQAMTYVDRLELALMEDSIEDLNNLLYATEEATDATWGLVYANLALLDLDEDQYEAALHNINAIRSLATSAVNSIGQVTDSVIDELETMESACGDILKYVIEMLKQQINDEIQALEDMKDAYSDLISLRKESLKAAKEEADYEKNISKQVNEIAKLQAKIDALSLDDSREAQAERASLMEQMAELQEELADTQEEHAIEAQEDALDEMEESYKKEKDEEIAILEDTISSYQKQYDMAIAYIEEHWDTLYEELIAWNYQYGTVLNSEITAAWEACLEAAQRYGSYVNAISANGISADLAAANGTSGTNYVVGVTEYDSGSTDEEMIAAIVTKMYRNSQNWMTASTAEQNELSNENLSLGAQLAQYGVNTHREADGNWYIDDTGELLFDKYRDLINLNKYHSGGIVGGDATTDQKEMLAILQKGEAVLDSTEEESVMSLINFVSVLADKARELNDVVNGIGGVSSGGVNGILPSPEGLAPINETTSSNVNFGSVYIYGANNDTVEKHKEVNRKFVNDVLDVLNIKR